MSEVGRLLAVHASLRGNANMLYWKTICKDTQEMPKSQSTDLPRKTNRAQSNVIYEKKGKRKVQGVPQSQTAALPRHQEEEETDKSKQAQIEKTYEKAIRLALSSNHRRTNKEELQQMHGLGTKRKQHGAGLRAVQQYKQKIK